MTKKPKPYALRAVGFATGQPCPHSGQFIKTFDHDAHNGLGHGTFTRHADEAMHFANMGEALSFWRKRSIVRPLREDGQPNAPLTCLTVSISQVEASP
jgi:hypothetical protein